jgi:hypothetical protein
MYPPRIALILTAWTAVIWTTAAAGAEEMAQQIISCRALLIADERLSCYDRVIVEDTGSENDNDISGQSEAPLRNSQTETASRVEPITAESATGEKQTETISSAEVFESQEALFGMSAEEQLRAVHEESTREEIEAGISELRYANYGRTKVVIWLDNGQIWQQIDSQNLRLSENDRVVVRRASFGSFLLNKVGSNGSMRVKRID